jgi:hypothetical protein
MMIFYSIVLFLHIVGALGLFVALALEVISLIYLQRANSIESIREWLKTFRWLDRVGPISMGLLLLSGFHMIATTWGTVAWIGVALAAMVLFVMVGITLTRSRMAAIKRVEATESGALSSTFRQQLHDPFLWTSIKLRVALGLGIVFLMTVKPELEGALLAVGVAIVLGLVATWPIWRRSKTYYKESHHEI